MSGIRSVLAETAEVVLAVGVEVQNTVKAIYGADKLNLEKVASVISYIAEKIQFPYMTRTIKLMWYSDALN